MTVPTGPRNALYYGDNLDIMREAIIANRCFVSIAAVRVRASHLGLARPAEVEDRTAASRVE